MLSYYSRTYVCVLAHGKGYWVLLFASSVTNQSNRFCFLPTHSHSRTIDFLFSRTLAHSRRTHGWESGVANNGRIRFTAIVVGGRRQSMF